MKSRINGRGGATAIDKDGNFGLATNCSVLIWASGQDNEIRFGSIKTEPFFTF